MADDERSDGEVRHVAFIMDGNGRWAEARGLDRTEGHRAGADAVRRVVEFAVRKRLPYLTLYAFSTENWTRPQCEVDALMHLFGEYIAAEVPTMMRNGVRLGIIGDTGRLDAALRERLDEACRLTAGNPGLHLAIAINYGGRDEIVRAARRLAAEGGEVDEARFAASLDTAGLPDPDMVVRTGGESRISNFLIWQAAYAELLFTDRLWPDFSDADFEAVLAEFRSRVRRFGGLNRTDDEGTT